MEQLRIVRMRTRVSLVVWLRDGFGSGPPTDRNIEVRLLGFPRKPIGKPDGTYVFNDLEPGDYKLAVASTYYFRETLDVSVGNANEIVHFPLVPLPSYPFRPNDTLVRAMVTDSAGRPIGGAEATATPLSEECAVGRVADEKAGKGSDEISIASLIGRIDPRDALELAGRAAKQGRERVVVSGAIEHRKRFRLDIPLSSAYARGSLVYPVYRARTTERGELAVAIAGGRTSAYPLRISLDIPGGEGKTAAKEIVVTEGATTNIGTWIV
ncbi:hypothetical protein [Paenibacillus flagellatus]|uniref:Carboxypeptidase regulatory-like domain-containing protein n=1 Tax=Paenibacillus flagellatus TaxID=2211139 RepID=A0A2V5K777_9BACL|nr:hypothetical protein [Paenibacillus flagellatus]PYI55188.1 hypothetical protein DLM86_11740 [Paenibacillus flagellatus]